MRAEHKKERRANERRRNAAKKRGHMSKLYAERLEKERKLYAHNVSNYEKRRRLIEQGNVRYDARARA